MANWDFGVSPSHPDDELRRLALDLLDLQMQQAEVVTKIEAIREILLTKWFNVDEIGQHAIQAGDGLVVECKTNENWSWDKDQLTVMFDGVETDDLPEYVKRGYTISKPRLQRAMEEMPKAVRELHYDALTRKPGRPQITVTKSEG